MSYLEIFFAVIALLVAIAGVTGTWYGVYWTKQAAKGVSDISDESLRDEYDNLIKSEKIPEAITLITKHSNRKIFVSYSLGNISFRFGGIYIGKKENRNNEIYNDLKIKINKSELSDNQKLTLINIIGRIYQSDGTNEIFRLS